MNPRNVLILPGWKNSGPGHWQTLWEEADGYTRVEQHSWMHPLRGDWTARLEDVLLSCDEPAVLVAHSLGCMLVAAWASHSRNIHRVKGALLVAPPDIERDDVREMLPSWAPIPLQKLPFDSVVFASSDDPFCEMGRARLFAASWGSSFVDAGPRGHLNADSGLADWPEAYLRLLQLKELTSPAIEPSPNITPRP
jgi:uncharacterized protein